jgi:large conductance mechanosensitive channel
MWKDFRSFAFKGNVLDLAVGVIIGAAFGKLVSGIVDDLIMPMVSLLIPGGTWREAGLTIGRKPNPSNNLADVAAHPFVDVKLNYGHLLGTAIDFFIVAMVLFWIVRAMMRFEKPAPVSSRKCPACCETVPKEARRCKFCTETLTPA